MKMISKVKWRKSQRSSAFTGRPFRRRERVPDLMLELSEKSFDDLFLRGVVIVKVARADAGIRRDCRGSDARLAKAVEEQKRRLDDASGRLPLRLVLCQSRAFHAIIDAIPVGDRVMASFITPSFAKLVPIGVMPAPSGFCSSGSSRAQGFGKRLQSRLKA